ncbi:MAG: hypothetical protein JWM27_435 [Gemmatimonadetes bacterium]|nr:hypothetical protein [Gemmatimonadota bacterium]
MLLLVWVGMALAAAASFAVLHYVHRLPVAPECPRCRAVTAERPRGTALDRLCGALAATPVRRCGRCGWSGRMRWRWAAQHVGGRARR